MINGVKREQKITFITDNELLKDVGSFKDEMHISTKSEAIRQLIVKGLRAHQLEKREFKYG